MKRDGIPFDGFGSVLEMLQKSDAAFREKILTNLRRRDPMLAQRLEAGLRSAFARQAEQEDRHAAVERGKRAAAARLYGN
jgi:hypothetical protein